MTVIPSIDLSRIHQFKGLIRENPYGFAKTFLGVDLWERQIEIIESIRDNKFTAVKSANAVGKTYLAAVATIWYLIHNAPCYVITTSSSWKSLRMALWPEIRGLLAAAPVEGLYRKQDLNLMDWRIAAKWEAFAVSTDTPENISGFRTPHGILVIVDEASHLQKPVLDAILGLCAPEGSRILLIGNPIKPSGSFYDACRSPLWNQISIKATETPNYITGTNIIPGLATREWVEECKVAWGEDSPSYRCRVLAEFPEDAGTKLVPLHWLESSCQRDQRAEGDIVFGVDIARFGKDKSVICARQGDKMLWLETKQGQDLMTTAGWVAYHIDMHRPPVVNVDEIGIGAGVVDRLKELGYECVQGVNVGAKALAHDRYFNLRGELYWSLRDWIQHRGEITNDRELWGDIAAHEIKYTTNGVGVGSKEEVAQELGRSPDKGDALALTFFPRFNNFSVGGFA